MSCSLSVLVTAWCADDWYGRDCSQHCVGLAPMALCEGYTGKLSCQPAGMYPSYRFTKVIMQNVNSTHPLYLFIDFITFVFFLFW